MPTRTGKAEWQGDLREGRGTLSLGSGAFEGPYSFASRFEEGNGTNPEELIAAAHAACYSMALSNALATAGHVPASVRTTATVHLGRNDSGPAITRIDLECEASVPGLEEGDFLERAEAAKDGCPVSKALSAVEIGLSAKLL